MVLPSLEPPAHTFRALQSCWHAGEGLVCSPVTSRGSSGAANGRAGEEYQVRARYQVGANPLLTHPYRHRSFSCADGQRRLPPQPDTRTAKAGTTHAPRGERRRRYMGGVRSGHARSRLMLFFYIIIDAETAHALAFTRSCHCQCCIAYGIQKGSRGASYIAQ